MKKMFVALLVSLTVLCGCTSSSEPTNTASYPTVSTPKPKTIPEQIQDAIVCDADQAQAVCAVIYNCGLDISRVVPDERLIDRQEVGSNGFWIVTSLGHQICIYTKPDNSVDKIRYNNESVYKNGAPFKTIKDIESGAEITMNEFNMIEIGMTYNQVKEIVGGDGELMSHVDLGLGSEYVAKTYVWQGYGTTIGNAVIGFSGGKVDSMAQVGLE